MFRRYVYSDGLTALAHSNKEYLISYKGQILTKDGDRIPYGEDEEGHKTVFCRSWDGEKTYRVIDLMAIQFKGLRIPETDYGKVIAFCIDGDKDNLEAKNIGYRFEGGKLEVATTPGFYYIPGYPGAAINASGELLLLHSMKVRNWTTTKPVASRNIKGGYKVATTLFQRGKEVNILRHRAMGLVFMDYPDNCDSLVINHKDGIPGHDETSNLEWITRGANNAHAYENDLKNQHKRVLVRDVRTGEVTEYYSITECARQLGYATDETIRQRLLASKFSEVFQEGNQVKFKDDPRDWIIPIDPEKAIAGAKQRNPVLTRNCITGEVKEYESVTLFCKEASLERSATEYRLKSELLVPWFGYQFKYIEDEREFPGYTKEEVEKSFEKVNASKSVSAKNHFSGEEIEFKSVRSAASHKGYRGLINILRDGKQYFTPDGWQYKFSADEWEVVDDIEEYLYKLQTEMMALNVETGAITVADSSSHMGQLLGLDPKRLRISAYTHGNEIYHGYRLRLGVSSDPWPETLLYARILNK